MSRRIADASPIVPSINPSTGSGRRSGHRFLAKLGRFELLRLGVDEVLVPTAVLKEVSVKQDDARESVRQSLRTWLRECLVTRPEFLRPLPDLGEGERTVLAQALQEAIVSVVLDDLEARRVARRAGLEPIGTVGLLLAALIPSLRRELDRLERLEFRISEGLKTQTLREAGEV